MSEPGHALLAATVDDVAERPATTQHGDVSVAMVASSLSRRAGGVFHALTAHSNALARKAGVRVNVYGLTDEWTEADHLHWRPLEPLAFAGHPPAAFGFAPALSRALNAAKIDVLHLHGLWMYPSLAALRWRRRTGRPVVISPHGMLDPWALHNSRWKKRFVRWLFEDANLRGAACLHALNAAEADVIRAAGLENPIAIIPNGVVLSEAVTAIDRPAWLPDDGRPLLVYIGRLHPKKGLRELVAAWAELRRREPNLTALWRLVIAGGGDGGHAQTLADDIAANGLAGDVILPGSVYGDAKTALLAEARAFILPSHSEGLPMAVLEAWAHEVPVLMTAACNLTEGFAVGAAVEISTDPEEMVGALAAGLSDPQLAARGRRGRKLVEERFAWDNIARSHAEVYRWLIHGGAAPSCMRMM